MGEARRAIEFFQQRIEIAREIGDRSGEAETSWNYGLALVREGQPTDALPLLEASLAFFQVIGHPRATAIASTIDHLRQHGTLPDALQHDELLASLPEMVRTAIERGDGAALAAVLAALPPDGGQRDHRAALQTLASSERSEG